LPAAASKHHNLIRGMSLKPEPESLDDVAEANIQAALREQAGKLNLSGLELTSLPESLGKLTSLQSLDISGNQLTSLPEWLGKCFQAASQEFLLSPHGSR
jgi:Leucine-rich repeat (LRR) protein